MASDILHIKDSYYFEVPRGLWRTNYQSAQEFHDAYGPWVIRNHPGYQDWEAEKIIAELKGIVQDPGQLDNLIHEWKDWQHEKPARHGRPLDQFLNDEIAIFQSKAAVWAKKQTPVPEDATKAFLAAPGNEDYSLGWFSELVNNPETGRKWNEIVAKFDSKLTVKEYLDQPDLKWKQEDVQAFNKSLSGKLFIPQPFATLRNPYETQSGFGISRYMIVEVAVALLLFLAFRWLAGKISTGGPPKGKLWNLLESSVLFVRNRIVVPAMGEHDADKFMPFMWTLFFFLLGCNLAGMIPGVGAPTSIFSITLVPAAIILTIGITLGVRKFGVQGYLKNLVPSLGLPIYLAVIIVPLVWGIEFLLLFIKHGVLAVRLLANMVAGHLVLLGFLGIGFGAHAASMSTGSWSLAAGISIVAATLLSFLELFVACLQAYIFTFLSALFISSATHHH